MGISLYSKHMGTMCKRSNYTPNSPQYEGDCEYRITSHNNNFVTSIARVTLFRSICFDTLALSRDLG